MMIIYIQTFQVCEQLTKMTVCKQCQQEPKTSFWCLECECLLCVGCVRGHESHVVRFMCQECEQAPTSKDGTYFCVNCEQHLCSECSVKIHNKAKRAKHVREPINGMETLKIKHLYFIFFDSPDCYGYVNYETFLLEFRDVITMEEGSLVMVEKKTNKRAPEVKLEILNKNHGGCREFVVDREFDEQYIQSLKNHYPMLQTILFVDSKEAKKHIEEAENVNCGVQIKVVKMGQQVQANNLSLSSISIHSSSKNRSNISAKYPREIHLANNSVNISTSTENSLRRRRKKSPIVYYHPFICVNKNDKRRYVEEIYREMAAMGTLMVKRENCKDFQDGATRYFKRNIGETEVEYVSLIVQVVSVECLFWVIRSIQADLMTPTEKLVISRLKESFDLKVNSKFWHYITKYLSSEQYLSDRKQMDPMGEIPRLVVHPASSEDNYILYCLKDDVTLSQWVYEDMGKLNEDSEEWRQFVQLINEYFLYNTQIGGGRYGCVQYIKFNSNKPLKDCSLGKLSLFVQEAINKGIIRYFKTVLVTNESQNSFLNKRSSSDSGEFKMMKQQQDIKILTLQLLLIDIFRESGPNAPISLAQIPQNLRKSCPFEINYVDLGFPKLKNLLLTLTEYIEIELTKSCIKFEVKPNTATFITKKREHLSNQTNKLLQKVLNTMADILHTSKLSGMAMQELYNQLNIKLNFTFDYLIFNSPDFYHFLVYYGQNYFEVQLNMGFFIVYSRWNMREGKKEEISTPKFNDAPEIEFKKFQQFGNWEGDILEELSPEYGGGEEENETESYTDYRSIYNLIDDENSEEKSHPRTVIVKDCSSNNVNNELFLSKVTPIEENNASYSGFEDVIDDLQDKKWKSKAQHSRMYSNNTEPKTQQHFRVYSNVSRD